MKDGKWRLESHKARTKSLIKFAKDMWCSYDGFYVASANVENIVEEEDEDDIIEQQ